MEKSHCDTWRLRNTICHQHEECCVDLYHHENGNLVFLSPVLAIAVAVVGAPYQILHHVHGANQQCFTNSGKW